jgi:hypothetical protein
MTAPDQPPDAATERGTLLARALAREEAADRLRRAREDPRWPAALSIAAIIPVPHISEPGADERLAVRLLARGIVSLAALVAFAAQVEAGAVEGNEVL